MIPVVRTTLILFLVFFVNSFAFTQRSDLGQIILGDTTFSNAYIDFPESWPEIVLVRFPGNNHFDIFPAGEITQFVLGTGEVFRAKPAIAHDQSKKLVFMQLFSDGDVDLYYFEAGPYRFYIETEDFVALSRDNYREIVTGLVAEDPLAYAASQRVLYKKNSLRHFFKEYNNESLHERPFPMLHAGVYFQYNNMRWNVPQHGLSNVNFRSFDLPADHFSPGFFVHVPLYHPKRLGLDLRFAAHNYETIAMVDESNFGSYLKDGYFKNV